MLDPKEAKKGGFGAFADRDRERREQEAREAEGKAKGTPAVPPSDAADGSAAAPDAAKDGGTI
jgi:hypothetical protein